MSSIRSNVLNNRCRLLKSVGYRIYAHDELIYFSWQDQQQEPYSVNWNLVHV